jgi:hypothetical protein
VCSCTCQCVHLLVCSFTGQCAICSCVILLVSVYICWCVVVLVSVYVRWCIVVLVGVYFCWCVVLLVSVYICLCLVVLVSVYVCWCVVVLVRVYICLSLYKIKKLSIINKYLVTQLTVTPWYSLLQCSTQNCCSNTQCLYCLFVSGLELETDLIACDGRCKMASLVISKLEMFYGRITLFFLVLHIVWLLQ